MGIGTLRRYHGAPKAAASAVVDVPAKSAKADDWKAYAASRGWDATQTKAEIVEQYEAEIAAAAATEAEADAQAEAARAAAVEEQPDAAAVDAAGVE